MESFRGQCNVVFLFLTGGSRLSHCSGLGDITLSALQLIIVCRAHGCTIYSSLFLSACVCVSVFVLAASR